LTDVDTLIQSDAGIDMGLSMDDFISDGNKLVLKANQAELYIKSYFEA